jgi:hypothetical protein
MAPLYAVCSAKVSSAFLLGTLFKTSSLSRCPLEGIGQISCMNEFTTLSWQPEVIEPATPAGEARLLALRSSGSIREEWDTLDSQLVELVVTRNPKLKAQPEAIEAAIEALLPPGGRAAYGVWVHYPWRGHLVRLLPESAFIEVRTNRNNNRILPIERDLLSTKSVGVVGLSVGQSFAISVAMERGAGRIKIADFDTLDLSNVNRIRTGMHQLGQPKWLITAREIAEIDPFLQVEVFPKGVTEDNIDAFLDGLDLICDACDDLATKASLRLNARARRLPVIMDTSDRGMLDVERYDQPEKIAPGYLHGRIDDASMDMFLQCTGWTTEALHAFVDLDNVSERGRASIPLLGQELLAWPQVYTEVASGGAFAAQAARRILLDQFMPDVRLYINLDEQFAESFS